MSTVSQMNQVSQLSPCESNESSESAEAGKSAEPAQQANKLQAVKTHHMYPFKVYLIILEECTCGKESGLDLKCLVEFA